MSQVTARTAKPETRMMVSPLTKPWYHFLLAHQQHSAQRANQPESTWKEHTGKPFKTYWPWKLFWGQSLSRIVSIRKCPSIHGIYMYILSYFAACTKRSIGLMREWYSHFNHQPLIMFYQHCLSLPCLAFVLLRVQRSACFTVWTPRSTDGNCIPLAGSTPWMDMS